MITYKKGYKYQLTYDYMMLNRKSFPELEHTWFIITLNTIWVNDGYAWDGSSVVPDTKRCMRASLIHDVLYQAIAEGLLDIKYRKAADEEYYRIMREDGMPWVVAQWRYWALRAFGEGPAKKRHETETAP